jgi:hypothetical protein
MSALPMATPRRPLIADADLSAFITDALRDPRTAARALATKLDARCTHHEGSNLAAALDNWAYALDADDLDALVWYTTLEHLDDDVRLAVLAIVTGVRRS